MRSVSRINEPVSPSISANMANHLDLPPTPPHTLRRITSTNWNRRIANRCHPLTPPPCSHDMQTHGGKGSKGGTIITLLPQGANGEPGGCERAWTRRRRLLFPGKFGLPELDPAGAVQSSGRRPVSLEAGRDQQHHRAPWTNRGLTPARLAATRLQGAGGRAVGAQ